MLVGYMRVSSDGDRQVMDLQRDALLAAGVDERHLFAECRAAFPYHRNTKPGSSPVCWSSVTLRVARAEGVSFATAWRLADRECIELTAGQEAKGYWRLSPERRAAVIEARRDNPIGAQHRDRTRGPVSAGQPSAGSSAATVAARRGSDKCLSGHPVNPPRMRFNLAVAFRSV